MSKPIIVGFFNPYSSTPNAAMAPYPERSAGHRLWKMLADVPMMALDARAFNASAHKSEYMRLLDRRNLFTYNVPEDRTLWHYNAKKLLETFQHGSTVVMLGHNVLESFNVVLSVKLKPLFVHPQVSDGMTWRWLPHPSGRCVHYNNPVNRMLAGMLLADLISAAQQEI